MITEAELHTLLADLEFDRVERTISTASTDKFAQAVCALFLWKHPAGACPSSTATSLLARATRATH